ncbi:MAG: carboxypeptidase regulatory-like domain-containing protein [Acidobacteria bacterium]|nr:carboxypeptidase regulatory-like domain-containing protein [Acidobacteriota bacterium]MBI3426624.1 carboxypeptidase regulatory-like domain-containing protein [Acidobacteriota bacterium]
MLRSMKTTGNEFLLTALRLWLALLVSCVSLSAQTPLTLRGQVVDEQGGVIPGARVALTGVDGRVLTVVANANGEFSFEKPAPATYALNVEAAGFQLYNLPALRVPHSQPVLKVVLTVAAVASETEVNAAENGVSVEPDQNMDATILGEDFIETLPDNEEDLREYLLLLAGPAAGAQGGGQIYINGFRGGSLPPKEAILQIRINQNPFAAEYERPGAGRVEIITKPGNNQWHGGGGVSFRNAALDARNAFAETKPELDQRRYSFNLSGPLIRKRLSFFANADQRRLAGSGVVRAEILSGPFVTNVPTPNESRSFSLRADYLLSKNNTFNLVYSRSSGKNTNREFAARAASGGVSNYTLPERASSSDDLNHSLQLGEVWLINSKLIHEARLRLQYDQRHARANTTGYAVNVLDAFYGGGAACCPSNTRAFDAEYQDYLTYSLKRHTLRGVVQASYNNQRDFSASNFNGTYTFSSLDQYRRALADPTVPATQFTRNLGDPYLRYDIFEGSWFAQDDFRVSQRLTLSFGLRHEFQTRLQDKLNFAPRFGLAWSPAKGRKLTVRAGGGIFYTRLTGGVFSNTLRYNGANQRSLVIRNPLFPDPFAGGAPVITQGNSVRWVLAPDLQAPSLINLTASVERQITRGLVTSLTYNFARGLHQFRVRNINAPRSGTNDRPDPTQGNLFQLESSASSLYHGFQFRIDRRLGANFTAFGSYALSWAQSDADGPVSFPANGADLRAEWGRALTDRRHYLYVGGNWRLPWNWRVAPFVTVYSGLPFNITTGRDENNDARLTDRLPGVGRNADVPASLYASLPEALAARCIVDCKTGGQQINLRDFLTTNFPQGIRAAGPGYFAANLSVNKTIGFGQRAVATKAGAKGAAPNRKVEMKGGDNAGSGVNKGGLAKTGKAGVGKAANAEAARFNITLGAQITNLFNHVNFGQYSGVLTSPFFGRANSASTARQFEFNLRFSF